MAKSTENKTAAGKICVKLVRSFIGRDQIVRGTLKALGLKKIGDCRTLPANDAVKGMLRRVEQIVGVSE